MQVVFTKKEPPQWLLDMWKEIYDKTFGDVSNGLVSADQRRCLHQRTYLF